MKTKKFILPLITILLISTTACQATPQEPVVISKNDGIMQEKIKEENTNIQITHMPETYVEAIEIATSKTHINIEATVNVPETNNIPVAKIIPKELTQEKVETMIEVLMQGQPLYAPREMCDYSQDEIIGIIAELKAGTNSDLHEANPEEYKAFIQPEIEKWEMALKTAPKESQRRPADPTFSKPDIEEIEITDSMTEDEKAYLERRKERAKKNNEYSLAVEADLGKQKYARVDVIKSNVLTRFNFINVDIRKPFGLVMKNDSNVMVKTSIEDAQNQIENTLAQMGFDDVTLVSQGVIPNDNYPIATIPASYEDWPKCYAFYYKKQVNGVPVTYADNRYGLEGNGIYAQQWGDEEIEIMFDDTGILSLSYQEPSQIVDVVNENVELLPFETIMSNFKKQMEIGGAWDQWEEITKREITIDNIKLGLCKVKNKDNPNEYLLIPAWDFFGTCTQMWAEGTGDPAYKDNKYVEREWGHSYLTINAIDGSIIDRSLGY